MIFRGLRAFCRSSRPRVRTAFLRELAAEIDDLESEPVSFREKSKGEAYRIAAALLREQFPELLK